MSLVALGRDEQFAAALDGLALGADVEPARVVIEFNYLYRLGAGLGAFEATVSGRLKHRGVSRSQLPAVRDWVAVRTRPNQDKGLIVAVLPRRSAFSRRMAGAVTDEQVVAAKVDVLFVVMGVDA